MTASRSWLCWISAPGFVRAAGAGIFVIGSLCLIGWFAGLEMLKSVLPGLAVMKPNTAAGFLFAGLGLVLLSRTPPPRWAAHAATGCAGVLVALGAVTLGGHLFGWDPGLDRWLISVPPTAGRLPPGRMTPAAATLFLLGGSALLALRWERARVVQALALVMALVSLFALMVYLYGVHELYRLDWFSSMALHTATAFLLWSLGLLAARPDRAWMAIVSGENSTARTTRGLLVAAIAVPLVVGWLRLQGQRAGWYGTELGLALFALSNITILAILIWLSARALQAAHRKVQHRERLYAVLSQCNQAIVHLASRETLFARVCQIAVDSGRFRLAWIGLADRVARRVRPAAAAGVAEGFLAGLHISLDDEPAGRVPSATAIREGRSVVCQDVQTEADLESLRAAARAHGFRSMAAFPLRNDGEVVGALVLCSGDLGFFDAEEVQLLEEVAGDISFALKQMDGEAERREMADQMQRLGLELQIILDSVPAMIFYKDRAHRLVRANVAMVRTLGRPPHELFGKTDAEIGTPYAEQYARDEDEIAATGEPKLGFIEPLATPAGVRWLQTDKVPIRDVDGSITGFIGLAVDITERRWAEEALRASEAEFRASFCSTAVGQVQADAVTGQYLRVNPRFCELTGYSEAELLAMSFSDLTHPDDREQDTAAHERMVRGEVAELSRTKRYVRKDGKAVWVSINASLIRDASGQPLRTLAVVQDITERLRLEDQLRQSQKMEAIGQLAGGIAHDFNNLLTAISGNARLALDDLPAGHPVRDFVGEIGTAAARAADVVRRILTFSRAESTDRRPIAIGPVVVDALKLLRATLPAGVEVREDFSRAVPAVLADVTQIHQVVMNLGTNASHAMNGRGTVEVGLDVLEVDADTARLSPDLREGRYVCLAVSDNGGGMDAATLARIFEPFFTTKPQGQGTGLGLAVVHGIMKGHEGAITAYSQPGKGTRFHLYFPALDSPVALPPEAAPEKVRGSGERILFVDDEHLLVHLAVEMFTRMGYHVAGFTRPAEALETFRQRPDDFDLVITDLSMPGMTGPELAGELLAIRPNLPIIVATGYIREEDREALTAAGIRELVLKPNTVEELGPLVRRLLPDATPP